MGLDAKRSKRRGVRPFGLSKLPQPLAERREAFAERERSPKRQGSWASKRNLQARRGRSWDRLQLGGGELAQKNTAATREGPFFAAVSTRYHGRVASRNRGPSFFAPCIVPFFIPLRRSFPVCLFL